MQEAIKIDWVDVTAAALKAAGGSQDTLARRCGVDQASISRLATGYVTDPRSSLGVSLLVLAGWSIAPAVLDAPAASTSPEMGSRTAPAVPAAATNDAGVEVRDAA